MKPILFNTQMVLAMLEGRKTVTRRAVKPQPPATSVIRKRGSAWDWSFWSDCDMGHLMQPPYQPGDILWVRETWNGDWCDHYIYKADGGSAKAAGYAAEPKWRPSIHMPKEAARIFLRVKGVRVERLKDITPEQIDAEGCKEWAYSATTGELLPSGPSWFSIAWDNTIKPADRALYGWAANPWVWVISFEKMNEIKIRETL